jgi:hypothetical protein
MLSLLVDIMQRYVMQQIDVLPLRIHKRRNIDYFPLQPHTLLFLPLPKIGKKEKIVQ